MGLQKYAYGLLIFIASIFILLVGKSLLMPLVLAIIAWFVIKELLRYLDKVHIKNYKIPKFIQNILTFLIVLGAFFLFSNIIMSSAESIQAKIPRYEMNFGRLIQRMRLPINIDFKTWFSNFSDQLNISSMVGLAVSSVSSIFSNAVLILLYLIFILMESSSFKNKLAKLYPNQQNQQRVDRIISSINTSMSNYITLKMMTSFLTGFLSYIVLSIVGVDFAIFWAYLIFLLNFIPTIGSMIATIFPVLLALLQFGTLVQPGIVLVAVGAIQVLVGNILEPKLMGNSLNVSPLVVLISLAFWGWLWGVVGMIISVPITIMMIIACAQFQELRWIAVILSSDGELPKIKSNEV